MMTPEEVRARALDAAVYTASAQGRDFDVLGAARKYERFILGLALPMTTPATQPLPEPELTPAEIWGPVCAECGHTQGIHLSPLRGGCTHGELREMCGCPIFQVLSGTPDIDEDDRSIPL